MKYTEYTKKKQKEFNALPIFYAFSNAQLKKELAKRGLTMADTDQLYRLGETGGFYLKKDADVVRAYFNREDDLPKLMQSRAFAVDAFSYEMANHEYEINWQADYDVCSCFCGCEYGDDKTYKDYLTEGGYDAKIIGYYREALGVYRKEMAKWD